MKESLSDFAMDGAKSILQPADCGLVNGQLTLNGWLTDVAAIRGLFAPPWFSDNFRLDIRFDGRRVPATRNRWSPECLERSGRLPGWRIETKLVPYLGRRGALLQVTLTNTTAAAARLSVQLEVTGGVGAAPHWGFGRPRGAAPAQAGWNGRNGVFGLAGAEGGYLAVGSSLPLRPRSPLASGVLETAALEAAPHGKVCFHVGLALAARREAAGLLRTMLAAPEAGIAATRSHWQSRLAELYRRLPSFQSDNAVWMRLYRRSMLHLLLNEWRVPEFQLHPYYSTGGINGGCIGCYLWNYGEPYRLWSLLDPASARDHIRTFLKLDLDTCYAFNPEDGSPFGNYYPVNHEKIILLVHAYVTQTRDTAFLQERLDGSTIMDLVLRQALAHDQPSRPVDLVDYGNLTATWNCAATSGTMASCLT